MEAPERDARETPLAWIARGLAPQIAAVVSDKTNIASGILVEYRLRYFVVTVAHLLARIQDRRSLNFLCAGRTFVTVERDIIGLAWNAGGSYSNGIPKPDIGLVELSARLATDLGEVQWVTEDRILPAAAVAGRDVALIGFPRDRIVDYGPVAAQVALAPALYHTVLSAEPPLPEENGHVDPALDLLAPVPDVAIGQESTVPRDVGDLQGISGAGVFWLPQEGDDRAWTPARTPLLGIQRGVLRPSRRLVIHRCDVILDALHEYTRQRPPDWPG